MEKITSRLKNTKRIFKFVCSEMFILWLPVNYSNKDVPRKSVVCGLGFGVSPSNLNKVVLRVICVCVCFRVFHVSTCGSC